MKSKRLTKEGSKLKNPIFIGILLGLIFAVFLTFLLIKNNCDLFNFFGEPTGEGAFCSKYYFFRYFTGPLFAISMPFILILSLIFNFIYSQTNLAFIQDLKVVVNIFLATGIPLGTIGGLLGFFYKRFKANKPKVFKQKSVKGVNQSLRYLKTGLLAVIIFLIYYALYLVYVVYLNPLLPYTCAQDGCVPSNFISTIIAGLIGLLFLPITLITVFGNIYLQIIFIFLLGMVVRFFKSSRN